MSAEPPESPDRAPPQPGLPGPPPGARSSHFVDLTPLRESPAFARLWFGNTLAGIGTFVTNTAVGLHIYDLTGSTFMVSLVAWFSLVPMIIAGLYGGAIADRFDRRTVALLSSLVAWASTVCLALLAWADVEAIWTFYVITTVNAVAATIASATRQAITPRLLPAWLLPKAAALVGISGRPHGHGGPGRGGGARGAGRLRVDLHRRRAALPRRASSACGRCPASGRRAGARRRAASGRCSTACRTCGGPPTSG